MISFIILVYGLLRRTSNSDLILIKNAFSQRL